MVMSLIEKIAPDPLAQLQLASAVNDRMAGARNTLEETREAWTYVQASLYNFVKVMSEKQKGRYSNVNRSIYQGVAAAVSNQAPAGKLSLLERETGLSRVQLGKESAISLQKVGGRIREDGADRIERCHEKGQDQTRLG